MAARLQQWDEITRQISHQFENSRSFQQLTALPVVDGKRLRSDFVKDYLPERLDIFRTRLARSAP